MYIEQEEILKHISAKPVRLISEAAEELGLEVYVIGGYVRDIFLHRPSKDIDVVAVGSGIELAKAVAKKLGRGAYLSIFKNFGTAQVKAGDLELEFVGAVVLVAQPEVEVGVAQVVYLRPFGAGRGAVAGDIHRGEEALVLQAADHEDGVILCVYARCHRCCERTNCYVSADIHCLIRIL